MLLRQSRTLLRHCCWCGRCLTRLHHLVIPVRLAASCALSGIVGGHGSQIDAYSLLSRCCWCRGGYSTEGWRWASIEGCCRRPPAARRLLVHAPALYASSSLAVRLFDILTSSWRPRVRLPSNAQRQDRELSNSQAAKTAIFITEFSNSGAPALTHSFPRSGP